MRASAYREIQPDRRVRLWGYIPALGRWLRVVTLEDGETVHNAFPDRFYRSENLHKLAEYGTLLEKESKDLTTPGHAAIARWRRKQALGRTWLRRPDLMEKRTLSTEETALLQEFRNETGR